VIPVRTPSTNVVLTLPEDKGKPAEKRSDLPAERCVDGTGKHLIETVWQPDPGEQKALANGAPVILHVWGAGHPPVSVTAGEPPEESVRQLPEPWVERALGYMFAALQTHIADKVEEAGIGHQADADHLFMTVPEFGTLWGQAMTATETTTPVDP